MFNAKNGARSFRRRVLVLGLIESLHLPDNHFQLLLDSGQSVRCNLIVGDVRSLTPLFSKRVLLNGLAVWDIGGRFYRIDAEHVRSGERESAAFSVLPGPFGESELPVEVASPTMQEILATLPPWEGDETEEELLKALKDMG
jgi:hypothetical protein